MIPLTDISDFRARLARLDSCVLSDAIDRLKRTGVVTGLQRVSTDAKVAGPVLTVKLEASAGRPAKRHQCAAAIDAASRGDIIVVEHRSRTDCAGWGGLLSYAARAKGIRGVIVDGMCRDIDESRSMGFPVFARGVVPTTSRGRVIETAFNEPITIGEITVCPGDWVLADGSGIVFLGADHAMEVLEEAEELAAKERRLTAEIDKNKPISQVMSGAYEEMLRKEDS